MTRIALFVPSLAGGGAERRMLTLAKEFVRKGHLVDLLLAKAEGAYMDSIPCGVRVIDFKASRPLMAVPALTRYINCEKPHALFATLTNANTAALMATRLSTFFTKCVVCEASSLSMELQHTSRRHRLLMPTLIRHLYPKAHAIVAVSQGAADDLSRTTGIARNLVKVIYNPVLSDDFFNKCQSSTYHRWFQDAKTAPVIVGMGRLTIQKDFATLIHAFARVRKKMACKLIILGERGATELPKKSLRSSQDC